MPKRNLLSRRVSQLKILPSTLRHLVITRAFGRRVRFAGTAGVEFDELTEGRAVAFLSDARKVQNHIGTVHAAAMALLAESATGAVFAMNVADTHIPLLKQMHVDYTRRAQGGLRAVATLSEATRERIRTENRGEIEVPVTLTDATGAEPLQASMTWAWVPKKNSTSAA